MQISNLNAADTLKAPDVLAIETDGVTCKLTGALLAAALKVLGGYVSAADYPISVSHGGTGAIAAAQARSNLGAPAALSLSGTSFAALYPQLSSLPEQSVHTFSAVAAVMHTLTGGKVSALCGGTVHRANSTVYEFLAGQAGSANLYKWRVTYAPDGSGATVGEVYRFAGTAM